MVRIRIWTLARANVSPSKALIGVRVIVGVNCIISALADDVS